MWQKSKTTGSWFCRIQSLINPLDFDFVAGETVGNQDHLAMFFDFLSLQNQNPPVLPHEVTLQNQGLAYSQGFTNGSPTSALPNQTLRSPSKNSPWNLWKSLKLGKTLRNTVNHLEKVWKTTKTPRPWFHRIQSLINPLDFDFVEGETVGNQGHLAMFFDFLSLQNQNPPVLPHEVTLQNQGLAYSQGFTNGSKSNFISDFPLQNQKPLHVGQ